MQQINGAHISKAFVVVTDLLPDVCRTRTSTSFSKAGTCGPVQSLSHLMMLSSPTYQRPQSSGMTRRPKRTLNHASGCKLQAGPPRMLLQASAWTHTACPDAAPAQPLPALHRRGCAQGASKAKEFTRTLSQGPREFLVAMRSEGQFVGEMASFATAALRCATVRAKGPVRVRLVPGVLLSDCVERIPEVGL